VNKIVKYSLSADFVTAECRSSPVRFGRHSPAEVLSDALASRVAGPDHRLVIVSVDDSATLTGTLQERSDKAALQRWGAVRRLDTCVNFFLKSVNIWESYKQMRGCLMHFARLVNTTERWRKCTFLLVTLPNIRRFYFFFTHRLSKRPKPVLIWLLITPPHLKYVATLPCNLSLGGLVLLTLMFHKVVQQHMQGAMGFLINI